MGPRLAALGCLVAVAAAGCGTAGREDDAAAVAERFHAALDERDGAAACRTLAPETASTLEEQEGRPCDEAVLGLELVQGGSVADARVNITSAAVTLTGGGTDFLDEGPTGWLIAAAGCEPTLPDRPYECDLEG